MAAFPDLLPEFLEASVLDDAFLRLSNYYSQSTGKRAAALRERIAAVFASSGGGPRPRALAPVDAPAKAQERPELHALRAAYWRDTVRPLLADPDFIRELAAVTVRRQEMYYTTEQRDKDIETLKGALGYWDSYFS